MLQRLSIQNYVLIDQLEIDFSGKLNIITGETGAGKSIIVGALGLILGERADTAVLVNKEKKCTIEGIFGGEMKNDIRSFLREHDLDAGDELVLRREISSNGKSRAFINDTPVNLSQLQQLSSMLVDLHQQFDTLELGQSDFQREVLDGLAGNTALLEEYQSRYRSWQSAQKEYNELTELQQTADKQADYNQFQYRELEEAAFKENELENIDVELKMLSHSEAIKAGLDKMNFELKESETPIVTRLRSLVNQLSGFRSYHPDFPALIERLQSAQVEIQDIANELEHINAAMNYDPSHVQELNDRLSLGYKLQKKHGVKSTEELLGIRRQLEQKIQDVLNIGESIRQKEKEMTKWKDESVMLAGKLGEARARQVKPFEEKVNRLLAQVGMPNARLKVELQKDPELNLFGMDRIEFLFDANVPAASRDQAALTRGARFMPLRKVASGGELSRLMLCIKSLVARKVDLPTLIFDEIDTGISGEAARQVGIIMKDLALQRQVISITHQPQIAGKADAHFLVYKEIAGNAVKTSIRLLSIEERISTIAKMLSGEKPTAAALENAREMVRN